MGPSITLAAVSDVKE